MAFEKTPYRTHIISISYLQYIVIPHENKTVVKPELDDSTRLKIEEYILNEQVESHI